MGKNCFVISVIGRKDSEDRKYADRLLNYIIKPAANAAGFLEVKRADHFDEAGMITLQIVEAILNADMVIADLTHPNPNVYYELAIRHHTGKPLIQMMKHGTALPFDVAQVRTVEFGLELEEADAARTDLEKKLGVVGAELRPVMNPITQAREISALKASAIDHAELLGAVLEGQSAILSQMRQISEQLQEQKFLKNNPTKSGSIDDVMTAYLRENGVIPLAEILSGTSPVDDRLSELFREARRKGRDQ